MKSGSKSTLTLERPRRPRPRAETRFGLGAIRQAQARIAPFIHRTPVHESRTLNEILGACLFFKCENFQRIGAFKTRGAHNAVFSLSKREAARGVVTHSSGNHAAALALAARNRGIAAQIVMPSNASKVKIAAVERLGGQITFCEPTLAARETTTAGIVARTGATLIHPFDDERIILGQATAAIELLEVVPYLEAIIAPVGGGGLLSGTAIAAKLLRKSLQVYGAEPAGADDAHRSLQAGRIIPVENPQTIADGLRTSLGQVPFSIIRTHVDDIATVDEQNIVHAMRLVWSVMKIVIEPSAAVAVAALLEGKVPIRGKRVGVILSGGNVDLDNLPWAKPAP